MFLSVKRNSKGFSLVEMLLSSVVFVGLSAVTYSYLSNQQTKQLNAVKNQAKTRASNTAIERFKADAMLIDPNWASVGVPAVIPHQGFGLGHNYYQSTIMQSEEKLPDAVTFLRRDTEVDRFFTLAGSIKEYCIGQGNINSDAQYLYDTWIDIEGGTAGLAKNDWLLFFHRGTSAIGVIAQRSGSLIKIRKPSNLEAQEVQRLGNNSTGLIVKPGVLTSTVDLDGQYTQSNDDNTVCLDKSELRIQKIGNPVSYLLSYATNDGEEKNPNNLYMLNGRNEKRKMLVRVEYQGDSIEREYLAEVSNVEITYDHTSNVEGGVEVELGRRGYSGYLLKLGRDYTDDSTDSFVDDVFHYSTGIVAININIVNENIDPKDPTRTIVKNHNVKASFDSATGQNSIVESISYNSYVTDNLALSDIVTSQWDTNIGRPFFYVNSADNQEMIVPVWRHMTSGAIFSEVTGGTVNDEGRIAIFDNTGCPVNPTSGTCEPTARSSIEFNPVFTGNFVLQDNVEYEEQSKFFPTSVNTIEMEGYKVLLVGGVAMTGAFDPDAYAGSNPRDYWEGAVLSTAVAAGAGEVSQGGDSKGGGDDDCDPRISQCGSMVPSAQLTRSPGFATIVVPSDASLETVMNDTHIENAASQNLSCNVQNCNWFNIATMNQVGVLGGDGPSFEDNLHGLKDTANIAVASDGKMYAVPMTKSSHDAEAGIYEVTINFDEGQTGVVATPSVRRVGSVGETSSGQVVTAISETTVKVGEDEYLAVCTSPPLEVCVRGGACTQPVGENGSIRLMHLKDANGGQVTDTQGVQVATHNYACNSMSVSEDGDLFVSGRLTISAISNNKLKNILLGDTEQAPHLLLDDIAFVDPNTGDTVYADGYLVGQDQYQDAQQQQLVGWKSGMSSVSMGETLGLVTSNTVRKLDEQNVISEIIDVGIHLVDLPSTGDQVLVTIETDPINPNNTFISSTYVNGETQNATEVLPTTFIPGNYVVNMGQQRTNPTPLPSLGSAMSEWEWYTLFQQLQTPRGDQGLDSDMPVIDMSSAQVIECDQSAVNTCPR